MRINFPLILATSLACGLPVMMEAYGRPMHKGFPGDGSGGAGGGAGGGPGGDCINPNLIPQLVQALGVSLPPDQMKGIIEQLVAASNTPPGPGVAGNGGGGSGGGGAGAGGFQGDDSFGGGAGAGGAGWSGGNGSHGGDAGGQADIHQGQIMWAKFKGNACGFEIQDPNALLVAVRGKLWHKGAACGQKLVIEGPKGNQIVATIADTCDPGCGINLSKAAFAQLENPDVGIIQGAWMPAPAGQA